MKTETRRIIDISCSGALAKQLWGGRRKFIFAAGVNILVGPNGSGKSTLLKALIPSPKTPRYDDRSIERQIHLQELRTRISIPKTVTVRWFDFELNNPRLATPGMMDLHDLQMWSWGTKLRRKSHGEATREMFETLLSSKDTNQSVILLDEPEQALDFTNLQALREILLKKSRGRWSSQFIIATHAPLLVLEPAFNIIEMREGYAAFMRKTLSACLQAAAPPL